MTRITSHYFLRRAPRAVSSLIVASISLSTAACMAATWPINATPVTNRSFGSLENGSLHAGLDIPAARGTNVRAAVTARISKVEFSGGVASDIYAINPTTNKEYYYGHIEPLAGKTFRVYDAGTPLPANTIQELTEGVDFAKVRTLLDARGGSYGHLHFAYSAVPNGTNKDLDPLRYVFAADTIQDDIIQQSMTFQPTDGQFETYGQTGFNRRAGRYVKDGVTMIGELWDNYGSVKFGRTELDSVANGHFGTDINLTVGYKGVPAKISNFLDKPAYVNRGGWAERRLVDFSQTDDT